MRVVISAISLSLLLTFIPLTSAQSVDELYAQIEAAEAISNPDERIDNLTSMLSDVENESFHIPIYLSRGDTHKSQGRDGAAIHDYTQALDLIDKHIPKNLGFREIAANKLIQAYDDIGDTANFQRVADESVAKKDDLIGDIWAKNDSGLTHRMTGLKCDNAIAGLYRDQTLNFSATGNDAGCNYKFPSEFRHDVTLYITNYNTNGPESHHNATQFLRKNFAGGSFLADAATAPYIINGASPVLYTVIESSNGGLYSGAWTSVIGEWTLKTRVTWDARLGQNFGNEKSKSLLTEMTTDVADHVAMCGQLKAVKREDATSTKQATALIIGAALNPPPYLDEARPDQECLQGALENETVFISAHKDSNRIYTIDGSEVDDLVYVVKFRYLLPEIGELQKPDETPVYILKGVHIADPEIEGDETKLIFYRSYDNVPTAEQVLEDYKAVKSGAPAAAASITYAEGGDTNISLNPDFIGE